MNNKPFFIQKQLVISDRQFNISISGILLITFFIYLASLKNGFTNWDDDKYILGSEVIKNFSFEAIATSFSVGLYTPVTTISYSLDYMIFGLEPWGYHFTSLCLHLLSTFLVILFIERLSSNKFTALCVGLLFAVHPTHVEAVAWASSRKDLLYAVFGLLSMIQYRSWQQNHKRIKYILCGLFFVLACLSKPTALGLPFVFIGLYYMNNNSFKWKSLKSQVPFFIISLIIFIVGIYGIKTLNIKVNPEAGYNIWQVICMASYGIVFYFYKTVLPIRLSNYHVYPFPGKDVPTEYILAPFLLAIIIYLFIRYRKEIPGWNIGLILFLTLLLPTYRIYPAGYPIVAERYFYLSSIGLFFIIASFIYRHIYTRMNVVNVATILISGLLVVIMCFATYLRTRIWKNSLTLWSNTIKTYPDLYYAYSERGKYLLTIGNKQGALGDFNTSLSLQPNNTELLNTTSNLLLELGDTSGARKYLDKSLDKDNSNYIFYFNRGNILKAEGKFKDALQDYNKSLKINPGLAEAYNNRGVSKIFLGDTSGAYYDFAAATKLNPGDKMFLDNFKRAEGLLKK